MPRGFSRSRKAPNVHWTGFQGSALALSAGTVGVTLAAGVHGTETLMRTRGSLLAYIDSTSAPGLGIRVGVGFQLVPEGTGTTVSTSPLTDPSRNWFYYETFALGYEEMVTDVIDVPGITVFRKEIDSKAMRVVRSNTEIQMVVENVTFLMAAALNLHVEGRFLSQE